MAYLNTPQPAYPNMIAKKLREIQFIVVLFIIGIVVSGVTAFPIQTGINALAEYRHHFPAAMEQWILTF